MRKLVMMAFLLVFLVACAPIQVKKIETPTDDSVMEKPVEPSTGGAAVQTAEGKVAVSCDDIDLNDPESPGKVTVEYSDGTTEDFFDTCPGEGPFLTEYVCNGNVAKSTNVVCDEQCIMVTVKDPAAAGKKVGLCIGKMV